MLQAAHEVYCTESSENRILVTYMHNIFYDNSKLYINEIILQMFDNPVMIF